MFLGKFTSRMRFVLKKIISRTEKILIACKMTFGNIIMITNDHLMNYLYQMV